MVAQNAKCPNCGTYPQEWVDSEGRDKWPMPYMVASTKCLGCVTLKEERDLIEREEVDSTGLFLHLRTNPEAEDEDADG